MVKEQGFIPLVLLAIIAAVITVVGVAAVKNPTISSSLPQLLSKITQLQTKSIDQSIVYTAEGAAKASTILVKFKSGTSDQTVASIHQSLGLENTQW